MNTNKTQIEFDNTNGMWNSGSIMVYVNGKLKEHISVDDFLETNTNEDIDCADDIIDMMKEKYSIDKVVRDELDWR